MLTRHLVMPLQSLTSLLKGSGRQQFVSKFKKKKKKNIRKAVKVVSYQSIGGEWWYVT